MLVVLKGFQELVIFGKGLISSCFRQIEGAIFKFFAPKSDSLLSFISNIGIDKLLQLLVVGDLVSILESMSFP